MNIMGIKYEKPFQLNEKEINKLLKEYGTLKINNNISLNLSNIKKPNNMNYLKKIGMV